MVLMTRINFSTLFHRITVNRLSFSFFLFTFVACFTQGIIHSLLYSVDSDYNNLLSKITEHAALPQGSHTDLEGASGYWNAKGPGNRELKLSMCLDVPRIGCFNVFKTSPSDDLQSQPGQELRNRILALRHQYAINITSIPTNGTGIPSGAVSLVMQGGISITLSKQCTQSLTYSQQHMSTALREDLNLVLFQFWLLLLSVYAMINDSVPHILAPLFARVLLLAWSSYAIMRTHHQKLVFYQLMEKPGSPCSMEFFSEYFDQRMPYEIADLFLNLTTCATAVYLSWTLFKVYNARSFKCVGAPEAIMKLHKYFLALLAVLHLALFVIMTAISLWIDQLFNSYINHVSLHTPAYLACFILTCILILPWIASGYNATTRERPRVMLAYICIGCLLLFGWSMMFYSQVYPWTFLMWPYLGCHTVASFLLIIISIILGVICRLNFGKGLMQYLRAEKLLAASNFKPEVFEHDVEKAMADDPEPFPPRSSIEKQKLNIITTGLPRLSYGVVVSPTSKTTKEEQEWRGVEESPQLPIPTYYPTFSVPASLEPMRGDQKFS